MKFYYSKIEVVKTIIFIIQIFIVSITKCLNDNGWVIDCYNFITLVIGFHFFTVVLNLDLTISAI